MDKLTLKIKKLNEAYRAIESSLESIKKLFKSEDLILGRTKLCSQFLNDLYRTILNKLESEQINEEFGKIIEKIKKEYKDE
jgi:hypothetical protein